MATLISGASGDFTDAATWRLVETVSYLESQAGSTAMTTSPVATATFVPAAVAIDAVAVKIAVRLSGTPTNTITVELYNNTTAAVAGTCTINVADIDFATATMLNAGWYLFKFSGGSVTPNGTDSYTVRAYVSATSTGVSLYRNATAGNWSRMLRRTATQAPAAGDILHVIGEHTGAGTGNSFTVTMNNTATTDFGDNTTVEATPALAIGKRGTLTYGTAAATDYYLKLSGHLNVYSGGTLNIGTTGTPIPRGSTAVLEFDCGSDGAFGLVLLDGSTYVAQGLSRTSGKNVVHTKLTADLAAAGTGLSVADDTGWLSGDTIGIAPTTRTSSQFESGTLNGNAGASSMTLNAGATNAHRGDTTNLLQAHVVLLTRNVMVRGMSTALNAFVRIMDAATVDCDWVDFRYISANAANKRGIDIDQRDSSRVANVSLNYCVVRDCGNRGVMVTALLAAGTLSITNHTSYRLGVTSLAYGIGVAGTNAFGVGITLNNIVHIGAVTATSIGYFFQPALTSPIATATNLVTAGYTGQGMLFHINGTGVMTSQGTYSNWEFYTNSAQGLDFTGARNIGLLIDGVKCWLNSNTGLVLAGTLSGVRIKDYYAVGNTNQNLSSGSSQATGGVVFQNARMFGHTSFATTYGLTLTNNNAVSWSNLRFEKGDFGAAGANGTLVAHSTHDIYIQATTSFDKFHDIVFDYCAFGAGTVIGAAATDLRGFESLLRFQSYNRVAGDDRTYSYAGLGRKQTTIADSGAALQMTPYRANAKLDSANGRRGNGLLARAASGATLTVSVKVRKDSSYNGNAPRLVLKANASIGYDTDTVLDTLSVGADTWETLTAVLSATSAAGVVECVVDCDGTLGSVYVDTWAAA
jgi:hypothetical protein